MAIASDRELVDLQETLYTSKNPTRRWLHNTRRDWINSAIEEYSQGKVSASLEVGPGAGGYLPTLAKVSENLVAADIEKAYLDNAQNLQSQYSNLALAIDDITATQLDSEKFDLILCTEVVEHIKDSLNALKGLHKILKPEGHVILSTPQRYSPLEQTAKIAFLPGIVQLVRWIYNEPIIEMGHINLLTEGQLLKQIEQTGFSIVKRYKCGLYIPLLAEFTGQLGLSIEKHLEEVFRNGFMSWLLWTQCYVLQKAPS